MKKLFTLFALLACFMGAKAVEIVDAEVDFSKYSDISEWNFPNSWGGSESARARLSIQDGCLHFHSDEATDPTWDCQFFPIGGVNAEPDVTYTLHFKVKGDHDGNVSMLGFGQSPYGQFAITTDWVEGTVDYVATNTDGNILMQCGDWIGDWDIAYLKITHDGKEEKPVEWVEQLTNGDAEAAWPAWSLEINGDGINPNWRGDRAPEICAWALTMGRNFDDQAGAITSDSPRARPFPADIEEEAGNPSNHVFAVHVTQVEPIDDDASIAWSNQFWIESPKACMSGTQVKLHFRYKAEKAATVGTQIHQKNPSIYLHYEGVGDVSFTNEWQEFDKTITFSDSQGGGYSVAFNLTSGLQEPNVFYFDDLSWQLMKLDEGYFVAGTNSKTGLEYDYDNAVALEWDDDVFAYVAKIGTEGKEDSWVNEVMVSTVRGNDRAFKGATIKPTGAITGNDEDEWLNYTASSNAKIKLPAAGVWQISVDPENTQMNFLLIEGEELIKPLEEKPNTTVIVVKGQERQPTASEQPADEEAGVAAGTGQPWDNQFFIVANRELSTGEVTIVKFKYRSSTDAHTTTQLHGMPGAYKHHAAIGDVDFVGSDEWQNFEYKLTVPSEANGMKSIAFNMAEIKEACDYYITDVVWMLEDMTETLINTEGAENFYVKEYAGTNPRVFGTDVYTVAGTADLTGAEWNKGINTMTKNDDGLYEWKAENITVTWESKPEFKVVKNYLEWYPENNWVITPDVCGGEGTFNITITFNAESNEISVAAEPVVAGNPCDLTGDGIVNALDIQTIINACVAELTDSKFDITGDGNVNALDIQSVINVAAAQARKLGLID